MGHCRGTFSFLFLAKLLDIGAINSLFGYLTAHLSRPLCGGNFLALMCKFPPQKRARRLLAERMVRWVFMPAYSKRLSRMTLASVISGSTPSVMANTFWEWAPA